MSNSQPNPVVVGNHMSARPGGKRMSRVLRIIQPRAEKITQSIDNFLQIRCCYRNNIISRSRNGNCTQTKQKHFIDINSIKPRGKIILLTKSGSFFFNITPLP